MKILKNEPKSLFCNKWYHVKIVENEPKSVFLRVSYPKFSRRLRPSPKKIVVEPLKAQGVIMLENTVENVWNG